MIRPSRSSRQASSGFTLVEVVVSLTLLAIIAVVIYSSFRVVLRIYDGSHQRIERQARERVMVDYMRKQLGSLFPLRPTASFLQPQEAREFDPDQTRDALIRARTPLFHGTASSVTFVTVAPFMHLKNPGMTVVRYGIAEDERGEAYLGAMEDRFVGVQSFDYMADLPQGKPLVVVEGIDELSFSYYGYDSESDAFAWFDEWSGQEMAGVPSAIRVSMGENDMTIPINATSLGSGNARNPLFRRPGNRPINRAFPQTGGSER